jgi:hypothetical protein
VVIENRNGLVMGCRATEATGFAERDSAAQLLAHVPRLKNATAGADRAYDESSIPSAGSSQWQASFS